MICKTCGIKNDNKNKFCTNCGDELFLNNEPDLSKCSQCGYENEPANKFCINCGGELMSLSKNIKGSDPENFICPDCGVGNETGSKFCVSCGAKLKNDAGNKTYKADNNNFQKRKNKRLEHHNAYGKGSHNKNIRVINRKTINLKPLWITIGVIIGSIIIVGTFNQIFHKEPQQQVEIPLETKSSDPIIEAAVYNIASKFVCSCKSCDQLPLESCKCGIAVEERQFIRNYLEQKQKPDDIVIALANKYGWLKSEFAVKYKVDQSEVWNPDQIGLRTN